MKRRGLYARKRRLTFKARVKRVLMKKVETKKYRFGDENVQLYHNIGYSSTLAPAVTLSSMVNFYNIWADIPKGTASYNRIGDKITPRGMSLRLYLAAKHDRPNTTFRVIIARAPKAISGVATGYDKITNPFDDIQLGSVGNKLLLPLDNDRGIKALYDKIHRLPGQNIAHGAGYGSNKEFTKVVKLWIKNKKARDIVFDSTQAEQIVNNPILLWVIPYEQYSTLQTDNIATCAYFGTLYYKDP